MKILILISLLVAPQVHAATTTAGVVDRVALTCFNEDWIYADSLETEVRAQALQGRSLVRVDLAACEALFAGAGLADDELEARRKQIEALPADAKLSLVVNDFCPRPGAEGHMLVNRKRVNQDSRKILAQGFELSDLIYLTSTPQCAYIYTKKF